MNMKERIPKEFPDIAREPELLSAYEPVSMALYDADGEEMKIPVLPDDLESEYML